MSDNKNYTKADVQAAWSKDTPSQESYDIVETKTVNGEPDQTQLIDKSTGSLTAAVNATGQDALNQLYAKAKNPKVDGGLPPKAAVESSNEERFTSSGVLATPTQPGALGAQEGLGEVNPSRDNPPFDEVPKDDSKPSKKGK